MCGVCVCVHISMCVYVTVCVCTGFITILYIHVHVHVHVSLHSCVYSVGYGAGGSQSATIPRKVGQQLLRQVPHSTLPLRHQESTGGDL